MRMFIKTMCKILLIIFRKKVKSNIGKEYSGINFRNIGFIPLMQKIKQS